MMNWNEAEDASLKNCEKGAKMKNEVTIKNAKVGDVKLAMPQSASVTLTRAQLEAALKEINEPEKYIPAPGDVVEAYGKTYLCIDPKRVTVLASSSADLYPIAVVDPNTGYVQRFTSSVVKFVRKGGSLDQ